MTKRDLIIISAYTGYKLLPSGEFGLIAEASAEAIGRPIMTHEFADPNIQKAIREKLKPEIYKIIERVFGYVDFAEVTHD